MLPQIRLLVQVKLVAFGQLKPMYLVVQGNFIVYKKVTQEIYRLNEELHFKCQSSREMMILQAFVLCSKIPTMLPFTVWEPLQIRLAAVLHLPVLKVL